MKFSLFFFVCSLINLFTVFERKKNRKDWAKQHHYHSKLKFSFGNDLIRRKIPVSKWKTKNGKLFFSPHHKTPFSRLRLMLTSWILFRSSKKIKMIVIIIVALMKIGRWILFYENCWEKNVLQEEWEKNETKRKQLAMNR